MIERVARLVFSFALCAGAAIWAKGYGHVGDGFSAGTMAGLGAVTQYICLDHEEARRVVMARKKWWLVTGGWLLALATLIGPVAVGAVPVMHLPRPGEEIIRLGVLELHTALLFDLGTAVLVYGLIVATFDRVFPSLRGAAE